MDLEKTLDVAYEDVLREFDKVWCVQGLIVTCYNLVVTWKVRFKNTISKHLVFVKVVQLLPKW
jgi:hypothetical protein